MDIPATMKAAFVRERGPVSAIEYGELPTPEPGPGEVLVRVTAVAANAVDTFVRSGCYDTSVRFPFILGRDLVGVVVARGRDASHLHIGQRVWSNSLGYDGRQGSFADYAAVAQERAYPLPSPVDPVTAVAVLHPAATAYTGLFHHAGLRPNHIVFVGGGAGNVGSAVLQLASATGCRVLVSAHGAEDTAWCRRWGAEAVMDYREPDLAAQVRAAASRGVDIHWDTSGHYDLDQAAHMLAPGGRVMLTAGGAARPELPVGPFYWNNASLTGFVVTRAGSQELGEAAITINRMLVAGTLEPRVSDIWPLSRAAEAHQLLENGGADGRIVLRPES